MRRIGQRGITADITDPERQCARFRSSVTVRQALLRFKRLDELAVVGDRHQEDQRRQFAFGFRRQHHQGDGPLLVEPPSNAQPLLEHRQQARHGKLHLAPQRLELRVQGSRPVDHHQSRRRIRHQLQHVFRGQGERCGRKHTGHQPNDSRESSSHRNLLKERVKSWIDLGTNSCPHSRRRARC